MTTPQILNLILYFYLCPLLFNYAIWYVWTHDWIKGSFISAMWHEKPPVKPMALWIRFLPPTVLLVTLVCVLLLIIDVIMIAFYAFNQED